MTMNLKESFLKSVVNTKNRKELDNLFQSHEYNGIVFLILEDVF
jgi:hypothetical protein|tara:strand:+ start:61 stop:192 length:132 start_codon:yes stop_codon:yes gene_type:complete